MTVLIGIAYKGEAIAGIIHQPYFEGDTGRTVWGIKGVGAFGVKKSGMCFIIIFILTSF